MYLYLIVIITYLLTYVHAYVAVSPRALSERVHVHKYSAVTCVHVY